MRNKGFIVIILILSLILSGCSQAPEQEQSAEKSAPQIETINAQSPEFLESQMRLVGIVKPAKTVQIKSQLNGEIKSLLAEEGDYVSANQLLGIVADKELDINLDNLSTSISDQRAIYGFTQSNLNEAIKQAQVGVDNARIAMEAAKNDLQSSMDSNQTQLDLSQTNIEAMNISLQTAQENLANIQKINQSKLDSLYNASYVLFNSAITSMDTKLKSIDNILGIDNETANVDFKKYLSVTNTQYLKDTENDYYAAENQRDLLKQMDPKKDVKKSLEQLIKGLEYLKSCIDSTEKVLDNSTTGKEFTQVKLDGLKSAVLMDQQNIVSQISQAQSSLDSIDTTIKANQQSIDAANANIEAAKKQLEVAQTQKQSAEIGTDSQQRAAQKNYELSQKQYENALLAMEGAKEAQKIQLQGINAQINSLLGQSELTKYHQENLTIESTTDGVISKKLVAEGDRVTAYQPLLEVSDISQVKVNFDLISEDLKYIKEGDEVFIDDDLSAKISKIEPIADPISRQIKVEITYDNRNNDLIPETFVNILIPIKQRNESNNIYIPIKAVELQQSQNIVRVVSKDNKLLEKPVELGQIANELIEIIAGLEINDEVIVSGAKFLEPGTQLRFDESQPEQSENPQPILENAIQNIEKY